MLIEALARMLKPLVRFAIKKHVDFDTFASLSKRLFVHCAAEELTASGRKVNDSRISAMVGVRREDVAELRSEEEIKIEVELSPLARLVELWLTKAPYRGRDGKPRVLKHAGPTGEFSKLVRTVNSHLNPGTVLFELERCKTVQRTPQGIKLLRSTLGVSAIPERAITLLSQDVAGLFETVLENVEERREPKAMHIHTEFDSIPVPKLIEVRTWVLNEGRAFHKRIREYLSQLDLDSSAESVDISTKTMRVAVTSFLQSSVKPEELGESEAQVSAEKE
jgi:hypothetical protein